MNRIFTPFAVLVLALAACSTNPSPMDQTVQPTVQDQEKPLPLDLPEEILTREILEILMDEVYPHTPSKEEEVETIFGKGIVHTVWVRVIDPKLEAAARKVAKRLLAKSGSGHNAKLVLRNKTKAAIAFRIGSFWSFEVPLQPGEGRRFNGQGIELLDDVEIEIVDSW